MAAVRRFVLYIIRLAEICFILMDGAELERFSGRHQRVQSYGVESAGKLVPLRALVHNVRQCQPLEQALRDFQVFLYLALCILEIGVAGVRLEEMDFPYADEGAGLLCLVSKRVYELENLQRQVCVASNP